jgi:hypothetical protein
MGWRSSFLIVILVFGILFSMLYFTVIETTRVTTPAKPKISQEQALETVEKDLKLRGLNEVNEIIAYEDGDFESRKYVPYSEFKNSKLRLPLVVSHIGSDMSIKIVTYDENSSITESCSESKDALVCIVGCFSEGKLFWIVDIFSEYYAVNAMNGDILFSKSRQEQMIKDDPEVATCFSK